MNHLNDLTSIQVIDSHTGGEPTRIIYRGGPDLGSGPISERLNRFRQQFDNVRRGVILEPRGNDVMVGGLICPPENENCVAGIIFFNNHGYLGMCGHGLIGLLVTLKYLGRIGIGRHQIETPVGIVTAELCNDHLVSLENVPSYLFLRDVTLDLAGYGKVIGDVAWGGNWFFLVKNSSEELTWHRAAELTELTLRIRDQLAAEGITGAGGAWIDHVEIFAPPRSNENSSRNFVLCPGGAFDRSPCGTGTSAKLACLAADKKLASGELWKQESIVGSLFSGSYRLAPNPENYHSAGIHPVIIPTISGTAYICGESTLKFDPADPFAAGIT